VAHGLVTGVRAGGGLVSGARAGGGARLDRGRTGERSPVERAGLSTAQGRAGARGTCGTARA
jgi:hypothetical protein